MTSELGSRLPARARSTPRGSCNPTSPVARYPHEPFSRVSCGMLNIARVCTEAQNGWRGADRYQCHAAPLARSSAVPLSPRCPYSGCIQHFVSSHGAAVNAAPLRSQSSNPQLLACLYELCRNLPSSGVRGGEPRVGLGSFLCRLGYGFPIGDTLSEEASHHLACFDNYRRCLMAL